MYRESQHGFKENAGDRVLSGFEREQFIKEFEGYVDGLRWAGSDSESSAERDELSQEFKAAQDILWTMKNGGEIRV